MRNVFGILFLLASGFFVYMVNFMGFMKFPRGGDEKYGIMAVFCVVFVVCHLIGLSLYKEMNRKFLTGIVMFAGVGFKLMAVLSIESLKDSPEFTESMDPRALNMFSDHVTGVLVTVLFSALGIVFFFTGKVEINAKQAELDRQQDLLDAEVFGDEL